jgi:drug/metabolite transporter (DMT)-like permease
MMGYAQLVACALLWALTYHAGKFAVGLMPPLGVILWRFTTAVLILVPWIGLREGWDWRGLRRNLWPLLAMGVLGVVAFNLAMFYGLQSTSAVNASLIMAFSPILTACGTVILGAERLSLARLCGLLLGLMGVALVVTRGSLQSLWQQGIERGDVLMIGGSLAWAIYGLIPRRFVRELAPAQMGAASLVVTALTLWILCALANPAAVQLPPRAAIQPILFMGVLATALAYIWWNVGVVRIGASRAAGFLNLIPVFTMLTGLLLGQSLSLAQLLGAALVISGVVLAARS